MNWATTEYRDGERRQHHAFINQGLFNIVQLSRVFQNSATTDLSTCRRCGSIYSALEQHKRKPIEQVCTYLEFRDIPVFDLGIRRVIRPRHIYSLDCAKSAPLNQNPTIPLLTMMKQLPRLVPLIRSELPRLARCHHTDYTIPRVRAEFT